MSKYPQLRSPREVSNLDHADLDVFVSSDGGTIWHALKGDSSGRLIIINAGVVHDLITAPISISTLGDNTIVAADATKRIKVVSISFTMSDENDLTFKSDSNALSGAMPFAGTNEPKGMTQSQWPHLIRTGVNEAFVINLSVAAQVSGWLQYYKEA